MGFTNEIIYEVKYQNTNTGKVRSEIEKLDESEITYFFVNENNFIQFNDKSNPLIPRHEIIEIVQYRRWDSFIPDHEKLKLYNSTERRFRAKIGF